MDNRRRNLIAMRLSQLPANIDFAAALPFIPLFIRNRFGIRDAARRGFCMSGAKGNTCGRS